MLAMSRCSLIFIGSDIGPRLKIPVSQSMLPLLKIIPRVSLPLPPLPEIFAKSEFRLHPMHHVVEGLPRCQPMRLVAVGEPQTNKRHPRS
jgi:hypothetical protein